MFSSMKVKKLGLPTLKSGRVVLSTYEFPETYQSRIWVLFTYHHNVVCSEIHTFKEAYA